MWAGGHFHYSLYSTLFKNVIKIVKMGRNFRIMKVEAVALKPMRAGMRNK